MTAQASAPAPLVVAALYKFVHLPDYRRIQPRLLDFCKRRGVLGTLLLAEEGINGTIAGERESIDAVLDWLRGDARLADLEAKESAADESPFLRMKVKLKNEIVALGVPQINPNQCVGQYVEPGDWNALLRDPEVVVVDTRNDYEYEIGTFRGAVNPGTGRFRDFPEWAERALDPGRHKKVAMFCTGGIRCEKATAYLLQKGFEAVYHLKGGILKYLETVPAEQSLWEGECFVFDDRVAVGHGLVQGSYDQCHACRYPVSQADKASPEYKPGVSCPRCYGRRTEEQVAAAAERYKQVQLARRRGERHLGADMSRRKKAASG